MRPRILDASAVLAWLWQEPGGQEMDEILSAGGCLMSTVNAAEVLTKALELGLPPDHATVLLDSLDVEIVAHDRQQAVEAALLRPITRHLGLSLGDRACLALARSLSAPAVTADRAWLSLDAGVEIQCIR
ncbi:MAG: type II toxin-antitoxin system VapC family toxin [Deltaproteobacteria bacterium]